MTRTGAQRKKNTIGFCSVDIYLHPFTHVGSEPALGWVHLCLLSADINTSVLWIGNWLQGQLFMFKGGQLHLAAGGGLKTHSV